MVSHYLVVDFVLFSCFQRKTVFYINANSAFAIVMFLHQKCQSSSQMYWATSFPFPLIAMLLLMPRNKWASLNFTVHKDLVENKATRSPKAGNTANSAEAGI